MTFGKKFGKNEVLFLSPLVIILIVLNILNFSLLKSHSEQVDVQIQNEECLTGEEYGTITVNKINDRIPSKHADMNLSLRCYKEIANPSNEELNFRPNGFRDDPKSPELYTIFNPARQIKATSAYQVYDWDWSNGPDGSRASLLDGDPPPPKEYPVTMWGIYADNDEALHVPKAGYNLGDNTSAIVLYAEENRLTINFTRDDSVANGYTMHFENICVDRNLLKAFRDLPDKDQKSREKLVKLTPGQAIGFPKNNEVHIAVRDRGMFMDPRSEESWWSNKPVQSPKVPPIGWQSLPISGLCSTDNGVPQGQTPTPIPSVSINSCLDVQYSNWSLCKNLKKTRTLVSQNPVGCVIEEQKTQTSDCTELIADINLDSKIDINDFVEFRKTYKTSMNDTNFKLIDDYSGDNKIGIIDFLNFVNYYKNEVGKVIEPKPIISTNIFVNNLRLPDSSYSGSVSNVEGNVSKDLVFRTIKSDDFGYRGTERGLWKTTFTRIASNVPVNLKLKLPGNPSYAELRSATAQIETKINLNEVSFKLPPKPALYYLKTDVKTAGDYIETILVWVDDLTNIQLTPPEDSTVLSPGQDISSVIENAQPGSVLYLQAGIYELENLEIKNKNGIKLIFHPEAVLSQNDKGKEFIVIDSSQNIEFVGPGEIIGAKDNQKTVFRVNKSSDIKLNDFLLYKVHHRDGWTLHVYNSNNVAISNVKIISGNDGTDPDSSTNVIYDGVYIESQDDAVAIKTRGGGVASNIIFKNGMAKSCASGLKIGESTVNKQVTDVLFQDSTVYDTDRALAVTPSGEGNIGKVTYSGIVVRSMRQYGSGDKKGKTITVMKSDKGASGNMFSGSQILFEKLDADFKKSSYFKENVTIKNSILNSKFDGKLMEGNCPVNENNTINGSGSFC